MIAIYIGLPSPMRPEIHNVMTSQSHSRRIRLLSVAVKSSRAEIHEHSKNVIAKIIQRDRDLISGFQNLKIVKSLKRRARAKMKGKTFKD